MLAIQLIKACTAGEVSVNCAQIPKIEPGANQFKIILQIVFGVLGAVATIYMLLAGMQFITSTGNPDKVAKARQSIIYGAIGLAVAASAEAIVSFVVGRL